jgi:pyruvate/2-oxoglutarate dehydrogenase complex dihydrolipoamide dehydrogenase (E3) component
VDYICAENWLEANELPKHLAIIGGGYIGLEMSQFYRRMGSEATVIDEGQRIVGHEDEDVSLALQKLLENEGIEFHSNAHVQRIQNDKGVIKLAIQRNNQLFEITASDVFVATGRTPNTEELGLEAIGINVSENGVVATNERLETNVRGVWAAGDIRGGPMFTHTSWDDYRILLSQIAGDGSRTTDRIVPYAIFTDPQLGRVGMTEVEARNTGRDIEVSRFEMKGNGRAVEFGESDGFIKVIVDKKTKRILGAAVLSYEAAELIHLYVDLMNADAPYTAISEAIHIHPTLAEAVQSALNLF